MPDIPAKRANPFEKTLKEIRNEVSGEEKKPVQPKAKTPTPTNKPKKATPKTEVKKPVVKKATTPKVKINPKTGVAVVVEPKEKVKPSTKKAVTTPKVKPATKKVTTKKTVETKTKEPKKVTPKKEDKPQTPIIVSTEPLTPQTVITPTEEPVSTQTVTSPEEVKVVKKAPKKKESTPKVETQPKGKKTTKTTDKQPVVDDKKKIVVRPTPKKFKLTTKEEKQTYKKLDEAFNYVANLTWVIEERTMNIAEIHDLTLGEVHVVEVVNRNNNKPMTLIAKKLKVTVGSLITCVNRLIQKNYLVRTRDEMDRRVILLSVTPKAKKALKAHDKFHEDVLGLVIESGVTLAQATKVMSQFANVLEMYYDPTAQPVGKEKKKK